MAVIKNGWLKGIVNGVSTRLYAHTHSDLCVYGDPANGVTVTKKIDELNSNLESLSSFYVDMDTEKITLTGVDSAAIQFQPPKRDGYEPVAAIVRSISGENGAYIVASARPNGWVSVCNCKSITISVVFTIRLFYRKIK